MGFFSLLDSEDVEREWNFEIDDRYKGNTGMDDTGRERKWREV